MGPGRHQRISCPSWSLPCCAAVSSKASAHPYSFYKNPVSKQIQGPAWTKSGSRSRRGKGPGSTYRLGRFLAIGLSPLSLGESDVHRLPPRAAVYLVVAAEKGFDGVGGLLGVIVGNTSISHGSDVFLSLCLSASFSLSKLYETDSVSWKRSGNIREQVVHHVQIDNVVKQVPEHRAQVPAAGRQRAPQVRPGLGGALGDRWRCVL